MVSAASLTFVDDSLHHAEKPARRSCALATAFKSALHVKKNEPSLAAEEIIVNYKQFGFVRSTSLG